MTRESGTGEGVGRVVSDLTLKSVPCPSSPGVPPHSTVGVGASPSWLDLGSREVQGTGD